MFDEVKSANDRLFYFRLLAANPLVCFVNEPLVNYMVNHNPQSLSNLQDERAWDDHLRGFAQIVGLFEESFRVDAGNQEKIRRFPDRKRRSRK